MWHRAHSQEQDLDMRCCLAQLSEGDQNFTIYGSKQFYSEFIDENRFKIKHTPIDDILPCN